MQHEKEVPVGGEKVLDLPQESRWEAGVVWGASEGPAGGVPAAG